jgi:tetrahydromethanopterin S-methyltransferase subunit C
VPPPAQPAAERPILFQKPAQPSNGAATTSLILGVLGIVLVLFTAGAGFLFSLPASIAAWIAGAQGRKRVARGETAHGDGLAHAGVVLGIVGVVIGVIGTLVWVALLASGFDLEEFRRDLEELQRDLEEPSR